MKKVAVVDDSKLARVFAKWSLGPAKIELQEIEPISRESVLKVLREAPPDLVLLDVMMPACPGIALLEDLRQDPVLQDLPVLLITAIGDESVLRPFVALGISGYLHKPVEPKALLEAVLQALD